MYQEKRPTCVTVIGWAWIIIGSLMCLGATLGLFGSLMFVNMAQNEPDMPFMIKIFPLLAIVQIGVAVLGLVSGIKFLKFEAWSRSTLEGLTWILLIFILGFMVFWEFNWISMTSDNDPGSFGIMGAIMGVVITAIYVIPTGIMLKYLRGPKVRNAFNGTDKRSQNSTS